MEISGYVYSTLLYKVWWSVLRYWFKKAHCVYYYNILAASNLLKNPNVKFLYSKQVFLYPTYKLRYSGESNRMNRPVHMVYGSPVYASRYPEDIRKYLSVVYY